MTQFTVRTERFEDPAPPDGVLLDFAPGSPRATVQAGLGLFRSFTPTRPAADLMVMALGAYITDRVSERSRTKDAWTRDLSLGFPTQDVVAWPVEAAQEMLRFLTGDRWALRPRSQQSPPLPRASGDGQGQVAAEGVCLFSGGLDSLCGVIDLLEENPEQRLCLLSHYEGGQASTAQTRLFRQLRAHYGPRVVSLRLFLRPAHAQPFQARPLPHGRETTTRSRSLMFLCTALAIASSISPHVPVYLPENGYIGVNVPLTRARTGSLSTRTTHPHYLGLLEQVKQAIGVPNPLVNPYRLKTKGEMLTCSRNQPLLRQLAQDSISCSHPEAARYAERPQGNCGYCFPCLIRRASMAQAGWDRAEHYAWDALTDPELLDPESGRSADLRAVLAGTRPGRPTSDILRNGPLPRGERKAYIDVWRRGGAEVRAWITAGARGQLAQLLEHTS
ncbi:Qat anti-phage system QueC-like protein QatC [Streptomyces sp. NPDC088253]|uniref:Qat anti-phage system QueC-like protein QatC n=1 Tax=Streptomyces sp. NPDC088253 TaxID=3365846 RepID=UPI003821275C